MLVGCKLADVVNIYLDNPSEFCPANNPKFKDLPEKLGENCKNIDFHRNSATLCYRTRLRCSFCDSVPHLPHNARSFKFQKSNNPSGGSILINFPLTSTLTHIDTANG